MMSERPRLTPAMADVRRAVRECLIAHCQPGDLVLVALSGGPDSLALAAATAFEAPRAKMHAGAVIVDHGLQPGSEQVALLAASQAWALGLELADIKRVSVVAKDGPEADARVARYDALSAAAAEHSAAAVLLGHTLDDQAETVLLGLTRGAGATSLQGMHEKTGIYLRPLLGIRRETTVAACADQGLDPWLDPHNDDTRFTRVRIRRTVMPVLETELGPGIADALARTAEHLREDSDALDAQAEQLYAQAQRDEQGTTDDGATIELAVAVLEPLAPALLNRVIRLTAWENFAVHLSAAHTAAIADLVTNWHGQKSVNVPELSVTRSDGHLVFTRQT